MAGGGSGGHVTPLLAVAKELKKVSTGAEIVVLTDRGFFENSKNLFKDLPDVKISKIYAGKLRRYHSKSLLWHFLYLPVLFKNIRDIIYTAIGFVQAFFVYIKIRPDVVFCKGGFVCIPVGCIAHLLKIRLIIHDSDTKPGLTNRVLSKFAETILTGMPEQFYDYSKSKMIYSGIPVDSRYSNIDSKIKKKYKTTLGFDDNAKVMLLTGGGNGSESMNKMMNSVAGELLKSGWGIIHLTGGGKSEESLKVRSELSDDLQKLWLIEEFTDMVPRMLAADIVIARTSASTLQECANSKKCVIGIASPHLADQQMNSKFFSKKDAIIALDENEIDSSGAKLLTAISKITEGDYSENLYKYFAKPDATGKIVDVILKT